LLPRPTSAFEKRSRGLSLSAGDTAPASVTSRPSRIQVMPSATTTSVWNRPQRSRSSRAGISVTTMAAFACAGAGARTGILAVMLASQEEDGLPAGLAQVPQGNDLCVGAFRAPRRAPLPFAAAAP